MATIRQNVKSGQWPFPEINDKPRFTILPAQKNWPTYIAGQFTLGEVEIVFPVLLVNYNFWTTNLEDLENWLDYSVGGGRNILNGMLLSFKNEQDQMLFALRWAG